MTIVGRGYSHGSYVSVTVYASVTGSTWLLRGLRPVLSCGFYGAYLREGVTAIFIRTDRATVVAQRTISCTLKLEVTGSNLRAKLQ